LCDKFHQWLSEINSFRWVKAFIPGLSFVFRPGKRFEV
jgi:hypothetical protein